MRVVSLLLALLLTIAVADGAHVTTVSTVADEGALNWGDSFARDLALSVGNATEITYVFGDTLSTPNPDGTVASNSGAVVTFADPLTTQDFDTVNVGQVIPYTGAQATWNLIPPDGSHLFRYGLPPLGAVLEGQDMRIFYVLDTPLYTPGAGAFYAAFPMLKIGTCLLVSGTSNCTRDTGAEVSIATDEWPTGFHRAADGSVRFYRQFPHDGEIYSTFKRGRWTAAGGFEFSSVTAFKLDATLGISVWYSTRQQQWLAAHIDHLGRLRLSAFTGTVTGTGVLATVSGWRSPWDGYGLTRIDGADAAAGAQFLLLYSKQGTGFLQGTIPVVRVTLQ